MGSSSGGDLGVVAAQVTCLGAVREGDQQGLVEMRWRAVLLTSQERRVESTFNVWF